MKPHKGNSTVWALMKFLRLQGNFEANRPTFSKFLGLTVPSSRESTSVEKDWFSILEDASSRTSSFVLRYKIPNRLQHLELEKTSVHGRNLGLSTYASILDDVTTFGIIAASPKHPLPGVSISLRSHWGPAYHNYNSDTNIHEVDIVTTVTKLGRTLGFVRAEVRDPSLEEGNNIICYFDHVKYLPTGWIVSLFLTPLGMWFLNVFANYVLPFVRKEEAPIPDENILESFEMTSDTVATFRAGPQHTNGFGGLHGGFQAILMERLGRSVAQKELGKLLGTTTSCEVECERLGVTYQSSASPSLELRAHVTNPPTLDHLAVTIRIETLRKPTTTRTVVVSEATLTFRKVSRKSKEQ